MRLTLETDRTNYIFQHVIDYLLFFLMYLSDLFIMCGYWLTVTGVRVCEDDFLDFFEYKM